MASKIDEAYVELTVRDAKFRKSMSGAEKSVDRLGKRFAGLRVLAAAAFTGIAAAKFIGFLRDSISATKELEQATMRVKAVLRATSSVAGLTARQLEGMAASLEKATLFDDNAIRAAQATLLTFTRISKDAFKGTLETAMDMSAVLGGDLQQSVIMLGKAINDPKTGLTALKRVGISFSAEQVDEIRNANTLYEKQKLILAEINRELGGTAKALNTGVSKAIADMDSAWTRLQRKIGEAAAGPAASAMGNWADWIDYLSGNAELFDTPIVKEVPRAQQKKQGAARRTRRAGNALSARLGAAGASAAGALGGIGPSLNSAGSALGGILGKLGGLAAQLPNAPRAGPSVDALTRKGEALSARLAELDARGRSGSSGGSRVGVGGLGGALQQQLTAGEREAKRRDEERNKILGQQKDNLDEIKKAVAGGFRAAFS